MRRAAQASAASKRSKSTHRQSAASSSLSSSLRPDVDDGAECGETDPLLDPETNQQQDLPRRCQAESIFPLLQVIRQDVRATIDTHLDWEELTSLDLNYSIVRPLALKYSQYENVSIIFILLVNRVQFQRDADRDLALQNVNLTRASLCELLAMKLLRTFSRDGLELVTALTFPFTPFQGADEETLLNEGLRDKDVAPPGQCSSALELAIFSKAKKFIKSPLCQRCVSGIYEGRVVLSYQSTHAILNDSYKKRPLGIYDPSKAPYLDTYRLRVPQIRNRIEFINFCLLLVFYVWCLSSKGSSTWTAAETVFILWLFGFALDEVAQLQEHGLNMYSTSLYNLLDFVFCIIGFCWLGLRISSLVHHDTVQGDLSFDTLSLGAILLCPRVASVLVQDNVILLALKAMLADFCFFMLLAIVCFSGFLYTFWSLSAPEWTAGRIVWIMMKVWFGNSYVGFDTAQSFSPLFGPPLMVFFAVMANTLLLTILISLLSNTFSTVAQNASEEAMYQHACKTLSGISSDAIMSYTPPLNLVAITIMMPASFILSPRWLHKLNIALIQFTSWPLLLIIRLCSINLTKQQYLISGRSTSTSSAYMQTTAERASNWLSWMVPLPRSKANPDRDIIEAAFNHGKKKNLNQEDWEEWTASMLEIREDNSNEQVTPQVSAESATGQGQESNESQTPAKRFESIGRSHSNPQRSLKSKSEVQDDSNELLPGQMSNSSPLARIYGRSLHQSPLSRQQVNQQQGEQQAQQADDTSNKDKQKSHQQVESGLELFAEKNETHALIGQLMERMQQHEQAQKRIEELLQQLVQSTKTNA